MSSSNPEEEMALFPDEWKKVDDGEAWIRATRTQPPHIPPSPGHYPYEQAMAGQYPPRPYAPQQPQVTAMPGGGGVNVFFGTGMGAPQLQAPPQYAHPQNPQYPYQLETGSYGGQHSPVPWGQPGRELDRRQYPGQSEDGFMLPSGNKEGRLRGYVKNPKVIGAVLVASLVLGGTYSTGHLQAWAGDVKAAVGADVSQPGGDAAGPESNKEFVLNPEGLTGISLGRYRVEHTQNLALAYGAVGDRAAGWFPTPDSTQADLYYSRVDRDVDVTVAASAANTVTYEKNEDGKYVATIHVSKLTFTPTFPGKTTEGALQNDPVNTQTWIDVDALTRVITADSIQAAKLRRLENMTADQQARYEALMEKIKNTPLPDQATDVNTFISASKQDMIDKKFTDAYAEAVETIDNASMVQSIEADKTIMQRLSALAINGIKRVITAQAARKDIEIIFAKPEGKMRSLLDMYLDQHNLKKVDASEGILQIEGVDIRISDLPTDTPAQITEENKG